MGNQHKEIQERVWSRKQYTQPGIHLRIEYALQYLEEGENFLDIGCGDGALCEEAEKRYTHVTGVDISQKALEITKGKNIRIVEWDANKESPFEKDTFNAITCLDVIDYIYEPEKFLKTVHNMLKNDGIFILTFPNIRSLTRIWSILVRGRFPKTSGDTESYDGGHIHYFTTKDIELLLKKNGFQVVDTVGMFPKEGKRKNTLKVLKILFGKRFAREFLLHGVLIKAKKVNE